MAIIGFLFVLGLGGYLCFCAWALAAFSAGFTGKIAWQAYLFLALGILLVAGASYFAPFTVRLEP